MKSALATSFLCILCITAVVGQQKSFRWLAGTWKLQEKETYEIWTIEDDGQLSGYSYRVSGSDTVITETVSLEFHEGTYQYVSDVAGDQPPIAFVMTSVQDDGFVAENPRHDFPKVIRYKYSKTDKGERLHASIEGNGKIIVYPFHKIK
jgi:hypothetical protein